MAMNMPNELTEQFNQQWAALYNCMSKPMMDIAALNVKTFNNNIAKASSHLNEFATAKKPEDFLNVQMKILSESGELGMRYIQDVLNIMTDASQDLNSINKRFTSMASEAASKATPAGFKGQVHREKGEK